LVIIGVSVPRGQDGFAQGGPGGAGVQVELGGQVGADPGDAVERELGERPVPFGHQIREPGSLGRLPRVRRGRRPAAGATGALGQDPGAEPGQGGGGGQGQAEQPQQQAAEDGQRGGRVGGGVLVAGQGPGADDADQGVAGQGVGDGGRAQMARLCQPGPAARAFMNTLAATEARLSARTRGARRPSLVGRGLGGLPVPRASAVSVRGITGARPVARAGDVDIPAG
jgi:hypothetical protein